MMHLLDGSGPWPVEYRSFTGSTGDDARSSFPETFRHLRGCGPMGAIEVRLLGPVELRVDGLLVPVERVQVRRLLALLALRPYALWATDELVEELWPGKLPKSPREALRVVASRTRRVLSPYSSVLQLLGDSYRLMIAPDCTDLANFESLLRGAANLEQVGTALKLWRGNPFGGAHGPPSFDRVAARLEHGRLAADLRRGELLVAAGAVDEAVVVLAPLAEERPSDERVAVLLATALSAGGRRTEALAALHRTRVELLEQHGLDPAGALAALEYEIVSTTEGRATSPAVAATRSAGWLFGRDDVIEPLVRWLKEPQRGDGARCAVIEGPAGIGKSAFAVAVAERLGARTVHTYCDPDGDVGQSLASAFGVRPSTATGDARGHSLAMVGALVERLMDAVTLERMTLVMDDVQWASDVELRFLLRVVRHPGLERLSVLVTKRGPGEPSSGADADRLVRRLAEMEHTVRLRLGPLDEVATRAAYSAWGGRPLTAPGAAALLDVTGGVPYLVRVLAVTGRDPTEIDRSAVADHLRDVIATRVADMDAPTLQVLGTAAAIGRTVDLAVLVATCEVGTTSVASAIDKAVAAGLLTVVASGWRFDHELTRMHLAREIGPASRSIAHHAAMRASVELERDPIEVAHHVLGAAALCVDAESIVRLLAGADLSADRGEFMTAVRFLRRATELEPDEVRRLEIKRSQAWMLECAGDQPAAQLVLDDVFDEAKQRAVERPDGPRCAGRQLPRRCGRRGRSTSCSIGSLAGEAAE